MKNLIFIFCFMMTAVMFAAPSGAGDFIASAVDSKRAGASLLAPHKALYDVDLVTTRSGSQVINISGKMLYEWKPSCDAWITDHRFNLFYEYADSPGMQVSSDFATFETFDLKGFNFSARRKRNHNLYQEIRGKATLGEKGGSALFSKPEMFDFQLDKEVMFPMAHTIEMVKKARNKEKFFKAIVFDGSDDEGPVEINTFIGKPVNAMKIVKPSEGLEMSLLNTPAWKIRMAVFPTLEEEESSDYEMSLVFHENGIISDMLIEYDDFSVTQKLVALEKVENTQECSVKK